MDRRPTIKDIARLAGASTGTVHLALSGKKGVSDETREKIRRIALELGYQPNSVAAGLRRKNLRIAVMLPVKTSLNRFFFSYQWDGIRDYFDSRRDYGVEVLSVPYYDTHFLPADRLSSLLETQQLDGLICLGFVGAQSSAILSEAIAKGLSVVLLGEELPGVDALCSVVSPYEILGSMMAEQLCSQTKDREGRLLIAVGNPMYPSHSRMVDGFCDYIRKYSPQKELLRIASVGTDAGQSGSLPAALNSGKIAGCCAVSARDSAALGEALETAGFAGKIPAIGSDVFPESIAWLRKGVFSNLMEKNPYQMAYTAGQILTDYLLTGRHPGDKVVRIGAEMVFRSSLPLYDNGFCRMLL